MQKLPPTTKRVSLHTTPAANKKIEAHTRRRLTKLAAGGPLLLRRRLNELDQEWDTERVLETNAALVILSGLLLGTTANKKWLILSGAAAGFLLQHALQGWCPPLPILRAMGVRTAAEIERERREIASLLTQW
mgnify:CR=1 FL=1